MKTNTYRIYTRTNDGLVELVPNVPVKHGKWRNISGAIRLNDEVIPMVQCSECTMMFHLEGHKHIMTYNYCPHCGAKMDK